MKKTIICMALSGLVVMSQVSALAMSPSVYYNGEKMTFEKDPYIANERTMVPFRALFEATGAGVFWDDDTKSVLSFKENDDKTTTVIVFQPDLDYAFVNDEKMEIDAPAQNVDGVVFVPLRFVIETFGYEVLWDQDTYTVNIITK